MPEDPHHILVAILTLTVLVGSALGGVAWASRYAVSAIALAGLFIGSVLLYQTLAEPPSQTVLQAEPGAEGWSSALPQQVELRRQRDGHFYATLVLNGETVRFVVDTGASSMVLNREDAARIGLEPDTLAYSGIATTANGPVRFAPVRLDRVEFEGAVDRDVPATVNDGMLRTSLLGMSYLERYSELSIMGDRLILRR
ncbi:MAG: TIGR02281 family clan AA aspartic protease [Pseudomonadota bacterium]